MARLFSRLFNIRSGEWPRFLLLYLMFFLFIVGLVWGTAILEAAFLDQGGGVDALRWFFVIKALAAIPAVAFYTAFADRTANDKLLIAILGLAILAIIIGLALLGAGFTKIALPLLYLILFVPLDDILAIQWFAYVNGFYDTQSAKRIIPVLSTAPGIGAILAGSSINFLNRLLAPHNVLIIILIWLTTLAAMALLVWLLPYLLKETRPAAETVKAISSPTGPAPGKHRGSYLDNIREGYRYVSQSVYLRWMALSTLLLMLLMTFLQYRTSHILQTHLQTTQNISGFIGAVTGLANLVMLPLQLFLLNRIIGSIGLGNANLIYPLGTLLICAGFILTPGSNPDLLLPTAALAYFARTYFYGNLGYPIESLLYNAVPLRVKGRARAFIGGLLVPVGSLIGGLLLLLPFDSLTRAVPFLIGLLALAYVATAWVLRRQYSQALIKMLEQEDYSFLLAQRASNLTVADPATLNWLRQKLEESASPEFTIFVAKLISQIGGHNAIPILGQAARTAGDARIRAAIIDVLVAADTRGEAVRQLYRDFLTDPDGRVREAAIAGLEALSDRRDKHFLDLALKLLADPDTRVQARILPLLLAAAEAEYQAAATLTLEEFLNSRHPQQRARGVHVLNQLDDPHFTPLLLHYLDDPADEVRLEAALGLEMLCPHKALLPELVREKMTPLVHDPVERVRQAALVILGRLGAHEAHQVLLEALTDASPQVRNTAVEALVQGGKAVIPAIHPALNSTNAQLRKMTAVVLSRINLREFGPLVETYITGNLLAIYRNYGRLEALAPCDDFSSVAVMQSALREQNQQLIAEIFYLLAAIHDPAVIKLLTDSFNSDDPRVRANAAEALEALTTPQTSQLIAPLFEPGLAVAQLLEFSRDAWEMAHPDTAAAIRQLAADPDDPWLRAIMTYALGEMGAVLAQAELKSQAAENISPGVAVSQPTPPPQPDEARKRRRPLASLFDAVAGLGDDRQQPPGAPPQAASPRRATPLDRLNGLSENSDGPGNQTEEAKGGRLRPGHVGGALLDSSAPDNPPNSVKTTAPARALPFSLPQIKEMIEAAFADRMIDVRLAARDASRMLAGLHLTALVQEEAILLSAVEKIIFLKEVPFFQGMTIDQLKVLANVCEEELFEEDTRIFNQGDPGGALYVVVSGRVGIEQEKRKGSFARLDTIEAHSYFGEMNLFDNSSRSYSAIALQDTLTLRLRREPLIALARQYPDLSLELINVLSQRLREANDRIADLTRTRPRELHKLFDKFD